MALFKGYRFEEYIRAAACSKRMRLTFQANFEIKVCKHRRTVSNAVGKFRMADFFMDDRQHGGIPYTLRYQENVAKFCDLCKLIWCV